MTRIGGAGRLAQGENGSKGDQKHWTAELVE